MSHDFISLEAQTLDDTPPGDALGHYSEELLEQREDLYLDLGALRQVERARKETLRTNTDINRQIDSLNPRGVPPHFMTAVASERPAVLPEVRDDILPTFAASDRQGILWTRGVLSVSGIKEAQSGHDGSADNIVGTDISGLDTIAFNYAFDGTDWDRIRMVSDAADDLTTTTTGNIGTMAKLLGFDGTTYDRIRSGATNADDVANLTAGALQSAAFNYGYDGATWDRMRVGGTNSSGMAELTAGALHALAHLYGFNNTSFDRLRSDQYNADSLTPRGDGGLVINSVGRLYDGTNFNLMRGSSNNSDGLATNATNNLVNTVALLRGFNGSTIDRLRSAGNNADAIATVTLGNLLVKAHNAVLNGTSWDLMKSASAANQSAAATTTLAGVQLNADVGNWSVVNFPATNTAATVTKAAGGAGVRHVCTGITATLAGAAALATALLRVDVLDGATPIFSAVLAAVANSTAILHLTGLSLVGTANTAMVFQFSAAGGADTQEAITGYGYSVS